MWLTIQSLDLTAAEALGILRLTTRGRAQPFPAGQEKEGWHRALLVSLHSIRTHQMESFALLAVIVKGPVRTRGWSTARVSGLRLQGPAPHRSSCAA